MAGKLAVERGWAINIGGGFHHCSGNMGGGFCAYADITLTVHFILNHYPNIQKVMIIDLDAHQVGSGFFFLYYFLCSSSFHVLFIFFALLSFSNKVFEYRKLDQAKINWSKTLCSLRPLYQSYNKNQLLNPPCPC